MSKDFRIKQLRTTQIIASGSSVGTVPSLLLYSASAATNIDGGLHADLLSGVGADVWMFVSGAKNDADKVKESHANKVLFAGDVVISGTLYAEKQVMEVNMSQNSDLFLSGAVVLADQGAAGVDTGQARLKNTIGVNSGSIFVSTGSLFVGRNISGTYSEIKVLPTTVEAGNGVGSQDLTDVNKSLHIDINNLSGSLTNSNIASGDLIAVADVDATNNEVKKITFAHVADKLAGNGLAAGAGVVGLNISGLAALGGTGIHQTDDHFVFSDAGTEKKITFSNLEDAIFANVSGDATIAAGGALTIEADAIESGMLNDNIISGQTELVHADINDADEMLISDAGAVKKVGVDSLRDHFFGVVSGDVAIADGGAVTIQANAVEGSMLNSNVADTSTVELSSNTLSVLKVPNALTAGTGIDAAGTFDGAAARTISIASAQTTIQSVTKDDFTTIGRAGSANDVVDFNTAGSVKIKTNNIDRVAISDATTTINNTVAISGDIQRDGDNDTKISFLEDRVTITAGNLNAIDVTENGASSQIVINEAADQNLDFRVESNNKEKAIFVNSGLDYISIGADTGVSQDMHLFVSGAIGGVADGGDTASGVSVFGGDVVVSGSLLDSAHNRIKLLSYKENGTFANPPSATGTNAVAIGNNAVASGNNSIAMGTSTTNQTDATGIHSLAIGGDDATASGQYASAIGGFQNTSSGDYSVTLGRGNTASATDSIAIGKSLTVSSADTIAIGNNSDNAEIQLKGNLDVAGTCTLDGNVTLGDSADLIIPTSLKHKTDLNTHLSFVNDTIRLQTAGQTDVEITANQVIVSPGAQATPGDSAGLDVAFYVSGSVATQGTSVRATSLFGGDVHISGSLSGPDSFTFGNDNTKIFRDGNNLKFDDANNTVKTLSQLATVGISDESTFFQGVHAGSNNSKVASSASISFAGTQGVSHYTENVGADVYLYVSGGLRSDTAAFGRTTSVFGGATVFSGSATYLGDTVFTLIEATSAVKTPKIQDASGGESVRIVSQKIAVGNAINSNPNAIFEAPLADNTQAATTNETSNFNIFLNNRSVQTNAFAGIAFDVSTEVDPDSIGAAIRAERDTTASTTAANHDANLTFSTNDAGDAGLTERMRITHDGKVGIGIDSPSRALDVNGDVMIRGNNILDSGGADVITFDGSQNTALAGDLTVTGGDIFGPTDGDLNIKSDGNLTFILDNDNDETSQKLLVQNTTADIFEITETGDVVVGNDLFVYGNDIKDSGDNVVISFDGSGNIDNAVTFSGSAIPVFDGDNGVHFKNDLVCSLDTNTKIRFRNNDKISMETGGVGMFLLDGNASPKVAVFNEAGQDHDFRVESNNETHMLFVDGSTNRIGVGMNSPATTLEIKGATADETAIQLKDSQSSDTIIKLYHENGQDDGVLDLYVNGTANTKLHGNGTLSVASGNLTLETTGTDSDIIFKVDDSTTEFTALTIDGSALGSLLHTPRDGGHFEINDSGTDGFSQLAGNGGLSLYRYVDSDSSAATLNFYKARGNESSQSNLSEDDTIGAITWYGFDTAASVSARIRVLAAAEHGTSGDSTDAPGKIQLQTTANGSGTISTALEIDSDKTSTFYGDIKPSADDSHDIGSSTMAWQDLYLEGDIFFTDAGTIDTTGNLTVEASGDIKFTHDGTQRIQIEDSTGDVAIGTHDPSYRLDVQDSATFVANFKNTNTASTADVLRLQVGRTTTLSTGNSFIDLYDGNGSIQGRIRGNGSGGITYSSSFTGQHATSIVMNDNITTGMIVESTGEVWSKYTENMETGIPKVTISTSENSKKVFGVVASLSGSFAGMVKASNQSENETHIEVNSIGEGLIWVSNINGNIENGDYVTSSGIYGIGQKQSDDILRSCTVAKCTENINWSEVTDIVQHDGVDYKKYLATCTYHCG